MLCHFTENVVERISESQGNAYRLVGLAGDQFLTPGAVRCVCAAHIEIIAIGNGAYLIVPGIVALDLKHTKLARCPVVNDTLRQSLLGRPAAYVTKAYLLLILRRIGKEAEVGEGLLYWLTFCVVALCKAGKFDLLAFGCRADAVKHEGRDLFENEGSKRDIFNECLDSYGVAISESFKNGRDTDKLAFLNDGQSAVLFAVENIFQLFLHIPLLSHSNLLSLPQTHTNKHMPLF